MAGQPVGTGGSYTVASMRDEILDRPRALIGEELDANLTYGVRRAMVNCLLRSDQHDTLKWCCIGYLPYDSYNRCLTVTRVESSHA